MGLVIVLITNGLCSSRVQGELDGMLCGTQLPRTSPSSDDVLRLAAARTGVWILPWLQFQQNLLLIRPRGTTLKVCSFK